MTLLRILELAQKAALDNWARVYKELKEMPENKVRQSIEVKAYKELLEVEILYRDEFERVEKPQK